MSDTPSIGLFLATVNPIATPEYVTAFARGAEERGFDSLWVGEHVLLFDEYGSKYPYSPDGKLIGLPPDSGMLDPFIALTWAAAATSRVRLATGVCLVPQRNPVYTAKEVATLDWLSGGRVTLGVGVGWLEEEFRGLGVPFAERGTRCREYLDVMKTLWQDPRLRARRALPHAPADPPVPQARAGPRIRRSSSAVSPTPRCAAWPTSARAGSASTTRRRPRPRASSASESCSTNAVAASTSSISRCRPTCARRPVTTCPATPRRASPRIVLLRMAPTVDDIERTLDETAAEYLPA